MKIEKICIVCGKPFTAANPLYCLCSNDCRAKRSVAHSKKYKETHAEMGRKQNKKRNERYQEQHKKKYHCKICGTELPNGSQKYRALTAY